MVETVIVDPWKMPFVQPPPGIWTCPRCHGLGDLCDGMAVIGPTPADTHFRRATTCYLCKGKGRVKVTAIED